METAREVEASCLGRKRTYSRIGVELVIELGCLEALVIETSEFQRERGHAGYAVCILHLFPETLDVALVELASHGVLSSASGTM